MKNLLFLLCSIVSLNFLISCGDDKFESYDSGFGGASKFQVLLPSEITATYTDSNTGNPISSITKYTYDIKNRLTGISVSGGSVILSQEITYNEADDNVKSISSSSSLNGISLGNFTYVYEYVSDTKILEHTFFEEVKGLTNTLTFNSKKQLSSKDDANDGITILYNYDLKGNTIAIGNNTYTYDNTKGSMNSVKTPQWLFNTMNGGIPGSYNLINNPILAIEKNENNNIVTTTLENKEFNNSGYPIKIITDNGSVESVIEIKYMAVPKK